MTQDTLIDEIGEWLIDEALDNPDIVEMFSTLCKRLVGVGIPLGRARLTWPTLHPLFRAETILWHRGRDTMFEQFRHQDDTSEAWLASPMHFMFSHRVWEMRRHLDGPNAIFDFDILTELAEEGMTDYLILTTSFAGDGRTGTSGPLGANAMSDGPNGIIVNWACNRAGGFTDQDIASLKKIQRRFGVACKSAVQTRIARNIAQTYLGRQAGDQVLEGAIRLGDGRETQAVVWYTDMRDSTRLADSMESGEFLAMLNAYFDVTAGSAIAEGGEVLDFIGDAVLAIFPFDDDDQRSEAVERAVRAAKAAVEAGVRLNHTRQAACQAPVDFGVGMTTGNVMFGNIGVASRLSFSVIGPTVNEVERIETLTKRLGEQVLVSAEVAACHPGLWDSVGRHELAGVVGPCELFRPRRSA